MRREVLDKWVKDLGDEQGVSCILKTGSSNIRRPKFIWVESFQFRNSRFSEALLKMNILLKKDMVLSHTPSGTMNFLRNFFLTCTSRSHYKSALTTGADWVMAATEKPVTIYVNKPSFSSISVSS